MVLRRCRVLTNPNELERIVASKRKHRKTTSKDKASKASYAGLRDLLEKRGYGTPHELGRTLYKYIDCGPWTVFIVPGIPKGSVYYEDAKASELNWLEKCTGLRIGSIVEGSDVEVGPETLLFPFTEKDLDRVVSAINEEASFYWERDNSRYFTVLDKSGEPLFSAQWVEFADQPTGNFKKAQLALARKAGEILFAAEAAQDTSIAIPGTRCSVREDDIPNISY
jgi:hypothetical protein